MHEPLRFSAIIDFLSATIDMPEVWAMIILPIPAGILWFVAALQGYKSFLSAVRYLVPLLILSIVMLCINLSVVGLFLTPCIFFFLWKAYRQYSKTS